MGRLKKLWRKLSHSSAVKAIRLWLIPVAVASVSMFGVHQVLASSDPTVGQLSAYLQGNELVSGVGVVEGYRQVFYEFNNQNIYITDGLQNHSSPVSSGRYVAWVKFISDGTGQIFVYDVLTKSTMQVTHDGNNSNPVIDGGRIAWQQVRGEESRILTWDFLNSGDTVRQVGDTGAVEPAISGDRIVYAHNRPDKGWDIHVLDVTTDADEVVASGSGLLLGGPTFGEEGRINTGLATGPQTVD